METGVQGQRKVVIQHHGDAREPRPSFLPSQNKAKAGDFLLEEVSSRLDTRGSMDLGGDCTSLTSVT